MQCVRPAVALQSPVVGSKMCPSALHSRHLPASLTRVGHFSEHAVHDAAIERFVHTQIAHRVEFLTETRNLSMSAPRLWHSPDDDKSLSSEQDEPCAATLPQVLCFQFCQIFKPLPVGAHHPPCRASFLAIGCLARRDDVSPSIAVETRRTLQWTPCMSRQGTPRGRTPRMSRSWYGLGAPFTRRAVPQRRCTLRLSGCTSRTSP